MTSLRSYGMVVVGPFLFATACGGSSFSTAAGAGPDGGAPDDAPSDGTSASSDVGPMLEAAPATGGSSDASADAPGAQCPDIRGAYAITILQGLGCGDLNASAPECIRAGGVSACGIELRSNPSGGAKPGIAGDVVLQSDGSFANAALTEGSADRSGCTGTWSAVTSTLTVDCGGTGSSQSCVVALLKTSAVCN